MPNFTVLEVKSQEPWSNDKGQFIGYVLSVRNPEGREHDAKINKKTTSAPPAVGEVIDANLQPSNNPHFPPLLKAIFNNSGGGGGGGGGYSPEVEAAIRRQHSQEMALRYAAIKANKELLPDPFSLGDLRKVIDWFEQDISPANRQHTVHGLPVHNEPARTGAPEPTTPSAEYNVEQHPDAGDIPWEQGAA